MHQLCLRLVQTLVCYGHDLMENVADVLLPSVPVGAIMSMWRRNCHAPLYRVASQSYTAESLHDTGLFVHQFAATQSMGFWEGNEHMQKKKKRNLTTARAAFCGVYRLRNVKQFRGKVNGMNCRQRYSRITSPRSSRKKSILRWIVPLGKSQWWYFGVIV